MQLPTYLEKSQAIIICTRALVELFLVLAINERPKHRLSNGVIESLLIMPTKIFPYAFALKSYQQCVRNDILFLNIDLTIFTRHLVISLFLYKQLNLIAYN